MSADQRASGLAGVVAGETAICTVGKAGLGLTYRGYAIEDLAAQATFEEVAFLLLYGHLPDREELAGYRKKLISLRGLPSALKSILEQLPAATHPMDVLRTGCSALGCLGAGGRASRFAQRGQPDAGPVSGNPALLASIHHHGQAR